MSHANAKNALEHHLPPLPTADHHGLSNSLQWVEGRHKLAKSPVLQRPCGRIGWQMSTTPFDWAEFEAEAADPANHIAFTPVPRQRVRRNGWTAQCQQLFLFALSRCGSVARAARAAGKSPRSAYHLLHSPGADSFAAAWDEAIEEGIERVRADALQRALGGAFVPVFRRGKLVRVEHRRCERLALALLSGHKRDVKYWRDTAVARRHYREQMRERDIREAEERERAEAIWAEHQAILDKIEADRIARVSPGIHRIRRL